MPCSAQPLNGLRPTAKSVFPEYLAVEHVLTAPLIAARTAPYIRNDDFDFDGLIAETATMSSGEALLVRIGHELWAAKAVGLWELTRRLDGPAFRRVLEGLMIARGIAGTAPVTLEQRLAA